MKKIKSLNGKIEYILYSGKKRENSNIVFKKI